MPDLPEIRPDEIPSYVTGEDELRRWKLCYGLTMSIAGKFDPLFCQELYLGDIPTDSPPAADDPNVRPE